MPDLPTLPVTFRPSLTRAVLLTAGVAIFVVIATVAMLLEQLSPGEKLSFVFIGALLFGVLLMLSRPKVVADETGVTVVNITSRRHLEWAEILQVNLRPGDPWVFLNLSDGTSLPSPNSARSRTPAPCARSPRPAPSATRSNITADSRPSTLPNGPMS
jgi:hypothetical protein